MTTPNHATTSTNTMPLWSQECYLAAWRFAAIAHSQQKLPGTDLPYIVHIAAVAMEVMTACVAEPLGDPDLAIQCALLHDTLEDTNTRPDDLESRFGSAVLAGVQALSKDHSLPKQAAMRDSLDRIRKQPREVWMVKLADRISNLVPPPDYWTAEKIERYRQEAREILEALGAASPFLSGRLAQRIQHYSPDTTVIEQDDLPMNTLDFPISSRTKGHPLCFLTERSQKQGSS